MSAQAFFSSFIFDSMNSLISGCQTLRVFIFAARRVLPPDFTTLAIESYTLRNDKGPLGRPPPESFSRLLRRVERSVPVPLPYLKSIASLWASFMMSSIVSLTSWMKQAEHCGYWYWLGARLASPVLRSKYQLPFPPEVPTPY